MFEYSRPYFPNGQQKNPHLTAGFSIALRLLCRIDFEINHPITRQPLDESLAFVGCRECRQHTRERRAARRSEQVWHGHPAYTDHTKINPRNKIPFSKLYADTLEKIQFLQESGI